MTGTIFEGILVVVNGWLERRLRAYLEYHKICFACRYAIVKDVIYNDIDLNDTYMQIAQDLVRNNFAKVDVYLYDRSISVTEDTAKTTGIDYKDF